MATNSYESVLSGRYPSEKMRRIWSNDNKFWLWRWLWLVLASTQQKLGLSEITDAALEQMGQNLSLTTEQYERARKLERELRHDVMAHIHVLGELAPLAKPIIHLGATSCYVTDNTDVIQMAESLRELCPRLATVLHRMRKYAAEYRALPTVGYTHFQPASLVTVGKRVAMWMHDVLFHLRELERVRASLTLLGMKGATGTQDTIMKLFGGDHVKVKELDAMIAADIYETYNFGPSLPVRISGQTYTRSQDTAVVQVLSSFGATAHKIGIDLRLLQHEREAEEPFEEKQVGSSAMAQKRNPMRAERMCGLGRRLANEVATALDTQSTQMLERTLDDSSARRFNLAESFLLADAIAVIMQNIFEGWVVYPTIIRRHVEGELPAMVSEGILMAMVQRGGDRQECHEKIRVHSHAAGKRVKEEGLANDFLQRVADDPYFAPIHGDLSSLCEPTQFVGRAAEQVDEFLTDEVDPALRNYEHLIDARSELTV